MKAPQASIPIRYQDNRKVIIIVLCLLVLMDRFIQGQVKCALLVSTTLQYICISPS